MGDAGSLTAQDRVEIIELIGSYAHYLDTKDLDSYLLNFAADGTFDGTDGSGGHTGQEELREYVGNIMDNPRSSGPTLHFMGLPHIEGTSERCSARTYIVWFRIGPGGALAIPAMGVYDDECVKVDGRWVFEKRVVRPSIGTL